MKHVLITGASGGIGLACVRRFLAGGCRVTGMDIQPSPVTDPSYTHLLCDITGSLPSLPAVDILIHSAGIQEGPRDIEVNLLATIAVTEAYAFHEGFQSLIFMASASAQTGAEFPYYTASKGGVVAYMKNCAQRLAAYGAVSNSISAGGVNTDLNRHILDDPRLYEAVLNETLLHRWAEPEEVASLAWYLAVDNRCMTGQDLLMDSGEALKANFIW